MVKLPSGAKISSRKGEIVRGDDLLDLVKEKVMNIMEESEQVDEDNITSGKREDSSRCN